MRATSIPGDTKWNCRLVPKPVSYCFVCAIISRMDQKLVRCGASSSGIISCNCLSSTQEMR